MKLVAAHARGHLAALPLVDSRDLLPMLDGPPEHEAAAAVILEADRVFYRRLPPKPKER